LIAADADRAGNAPAAATLLPLMRQRLPPPCFCHADALIFHAISLRHADCYALRQADAHA